mgnify:CR=1 FL=1
MNNVDFNIRLADALTDMRALTLSRPDKSAGETLGISGAVTRAEGRTFTSQHGEELLQLTIYTADNKAHHVNIAFSDATGRLTELLGGAFNQLNITTPRGGFEAKRAKDGSPVITKKLPSVGAGSYSRPSVSASHNREKNMIIPEDSGGGFLTALGLADKSGRVYDKKRAKYRQINRFLEYLRDVVRYLPSEGEIYALDLCCGKSYLTFAAYYYLTLVEGRQVKLVGIDLKLDVIKFCADTASALGWSGLEFICGDIEGFEPERAPDLVLSLHACDIATDIVLSKAASSGAKVILSTPCCQHELYNLFDPTATPLGSLCGQPLIRHKLTDAFTDALRVLYLEAYGYEVNAAELIDPEETPKNTLIRAIKKRRANPAARERYEAACKFLGARPSRLVFDR